jgi:type II secretory pathway pseudopilin PulG
MRRWRRSPIGLQPRRGMTLVELLVTVSILMLLLVVALPALTPSAESRRIREAVRQMNVFFGAARAQAMQSGRPVGVALERLRGQPQACLTLYQVEVPAPYAGELLTSVARLTYRSSNQYVAQFNMSISGFSAKVSVGDLVRLNHQGPLYSVTAVAGSTAAIELDIRDRKLFPWPTSGQSSAVSFEFYRQPIRSAVAPMVLPAGVAIDLQASGIDSDRNYYGWFTPTPAELGSTSPNPVVLMFSPSGSLDRVYFSRATASRGYEVLREPIYLLVGRRDRITVSQNVTASTSVEEYPNWFDPSSLWLMVSPQTGIVSAKENYRVPVASGSFTTGCSIARQLARQAQTIGGR